MSDDSPNSRQLHGRGSWQAAVLTIATTQAPSRIPDQPYVDCLDDSLVAEHGRPAVPRRVAFWLLALVFTISMFGTTLPTPLYVIYQAQWHFSAAIVTVTLGSVRVHRGLRGRAGLLYPARCPVHGLPQQHPEGAVRACPGDHGTGPRSRRPPTPC